MMQQVLAAANAGQRRVGDRVANRHLHRLSHFSVDFVDDQGQAQGFAHMTCHLEDAAVLTVKIDGNDGGPSHLNQLGDKGLYLQGEINF